MNSNLGVPFHSILMTIIQDIIRYKTKVSHKYVVVMYHRNTPLPKMRKGLDGYTQHNLTNLQTIVADVTLHELQSTTLAS
jgi:hypothetical protein